MSNTSWRSLCSITALLSCSRLNGEYWGGSLKNCACCSRDALMMLFRVKKVNSPTVRPKTFHDLHRGRIGGNTHFAEQPLGSVNRSINIKALCLWLMAAPCSYHLLWEIETQSPFQNPVQRYSEIYMV